jgi:hypothetical protein
MIISGIERAHSIYYQIYISHTIQSLFLGLFKPRPGLTEAQNPAKEKMEEVICVF